MWRRWLFLLLVTATLSAMVPAADDAPRKRGYAKVEETRPKAFPQRIWAACDFEGQTPDYAWFGPAQK